MASSAPTPQDSAYADRRVYPRVSVALPAFLQVNGDRRAVQILDLSAGGAKLNYAETLPVGTQVTLDCGTFSRAAAVRWQNGGALGLCFEGELDAREVAALIERSDALVALMKTRD